MENQTITVEEATQIIADAIREYGRPYWVAYVPRSIRTRVPYPVIESMLNNTEKIPVRRSEKYQSIVDWTQDNLYEEVTPQTIMEVGNISYPTALKFISDHPDIFRKVRRGVYELRDPVADRQK